MWVMVVLGVMVSGGRSVKKWWWVGVITVAVIIVGRIGEAQAHYTFGLAILMVVLGVRLLGENKKLGWLLAVWLVVEMVLFLQRPMVEVERNLYWVKDRAEEIMRAGLFSKEEKINLQVARGVEALVPAGDDYRFFLELAGYQVAGPFEYRAIDKLVVVSETKELRVDEWDDWSIGEFKVLPYVVGEKEELNGVEVRVLERE
jgi:hypothetical protein